MTAFLPARGVAREKYFQAFARALVATNYLLGRRDTALVAGVTLSDPEGRRELATSRGRLVSGSRERRAQALAAEVGRIVRSLRTRRVR